MSNKPTNRYKMFRNFMCNELKIDRADIENWTREAIREQVIKSLSGMDLEAIAKSTLNDRFGWAFTKQVKESVAAELANRINLVLMTQPVNDDKDEENIEVH